MNTLWASAPLPSIPVPSAGETITDHDFPRILPAEVNSCKLPSVPVEPAASKVELLAGEEGYQPLFRQDCCFAYATASPFDLRRIDVLNPHPLSGSTAALDEECVAIPYPQYRRFERVPFDEHGSNDNMPVVCATAGRSGATDQDAD